MRAKEEKKTAVYVGTRNLYSDMVVSAKSLFANSDVDKVFFLIEDDAFPEKLPGEIGTINMSGQKFFERGSPNYGTHWTYMALLKAAYGLIFRDVAKILHLDDDTVIVDDISDLWELDMGECCCAGVRDYGVNAEGYINGGVVLEDLEKMRADGIPERMVRMLNERYYRYIDQDVMNECCRGRIFQMPSRYNESMVTGRTFNPAIVHYVGVNKVSWELNGQRRHYYEEYRAMSWEDVATLREKRYGKVLTL